MQDRPMTKAEKEMTLIMATIRTAYPAYYRSQTDQNIDDAIRLWIEILEDTDFSLNLKAVKQFIKTDRRGFPPTPGQIATLAIEIRKSEWDKRQRETDLLPAPEIQRVPMPPEIRQKYEAFKKGLSYE